MTTVHIENTINDYEAWQEAFDKYESFRAEHGVRSYRISRGAADPQQVNVDLCFDSRAEAEAFLPRLQQIWSTPQSQRAAGGPHATGTARGRPRPRARGRARSTPGTQKAPRAPGRAHLPLLPSGPGGFSEIPPHGGLAQSLGETRRLPQTGRVATGRPGRHTNVVAMAARTYDVSRDVIRVGRHRSQNV